MEDQIPEDHLLRLIDRYVDFSFVRERLKGFYSPTGRPSIDPEVLLRLLLVGYLMGSPASGVCWKKCDASGLSLVHTAGFRPGDPGPLDFSKNRHGRFRQSGVFREVFEEIVRRCLEAGLVEGREPGRGRNDGGSQRQSTKSSAPGTLRRSSAGVAYRAAVSGPNWEQVNPVSQTRRPFPPLTPMRPGPPRAGPATMAYYDNYLIDTASRVILEVEATPGTSRQEMVAARRMLGRVEKLGLRPESLGADKAYGSGEFLAWLLGRGVQPHIPVIDRRHQTGGRFTRD